MCEDAANKLSDYCNAVQPNSTFSTVPTNCHRCSRGREPSLACHCVYPLTGVFTLRSPSFSGFFNNSRFITFQQNLTAFFKNGKYPVDSVAIRNISENPTDYHLLINILIFPLGEKRFNETGMYSVLSAFSMQTYKPPDRFGPYIFVADTYGQYSGMMETGTIHLYQIYIGLV